MSGKFRYCSNFIYVIIGLTAYCIFAYRDDDLLSKIIIILYGIIAFIYYCNARGNFDATEDKLEIGKYFWSFDIPYESINNITVEKIYRKSIEDVYDKKYVRKIRLKIDYDDVIVIFDAKLKFTFRENVNEADNHCFYKLYDYVNQQRIKKHRNKKKVLNR